MSTLVDIDVRYTKKDIKKLITELCKPIGLITLSKIIEHHDGDPAVVRDYIKGIGEGRTQTCGVLVSEKISEKAQEYHKELYHCMYEVSLKDLLKLVNTDEDVRPAVLWRFSIRK